MDDASTPPEPVVSTSTVVSAPPDAAASLPSIPSKAPNELLEDGDNRAPECTICYESEPATWGVLDCCDHTFCYECIREWQSVNAPSESSDSYGRNDLQTVLSIEDAQAKNACPLCRRKIYLVMPTPNLFGSKEEKEEAFEVFEDGLSETPCRALMTSDPNQPYCPHGRECPYSHTHHGTGYHYTFAQTYTEHLLAMQRLSHERQAQRFMLALLSSNGLLASSLLPTLPLLPDGVRDLVEELAEMVRDGRLARFKNRIGALGNEVLWRRSVTERTWVGEGEEPAEGADVDDGDEWVDEEDEEDEEEAPRADSEGEDSWGCDDDAMGAEDFPGVQPVSSYALGRLLGARTQGRNGAAGREEDSDEEDSDDSDDDDLPALESIDGSDEDDLPPLEEIDTDDLPLPARTARSPSPALRSSSDDDDDSASVAGSSVYEDADADPSPTHASSSAAPSPAASVSFASTFSSAFPSPRPLTPAAAPSVFPPSLAHSAPTPSSAAHGAVQHLRSLSRSRGAPLPHSTESDPHPDSDSDSDSASSTSSSAFNSGEDTDDFIAFHVSDCARANRLLDLADEEEEGSARRAALLEEAERLAGRWHLKRTAQGRFVLRDRGFATDEEDEEEEEEEEERAYAQEDEEEDESSDSDSSSSSDDSYDNRPHVETSSVTICVRSSPSPAPPAASSPPLSASRSAAPSSFDSSAPPPAPIRSMSRWTTLSTTTTTTTTYPRESSPSPAEREREKRRRRAAQAAERRRAEEKWEEMD
ncbi:hypothetical protein JCM6882_005950 [Rhodosporidiobolus microsporus]